MEKKILKLLLLAAAAGMILRFFTQIIMILMMNEDGTWSDEINTNLFYIRILMSAALFIGIGLILKKTYDRRTMFKAATVLSLFFLAVYILEQTSFYENGYMMLLHYLYLPGEIFSWITYGMLMLFGSENYSRLFVIPHLLAPYLFMIFTLKPKSSKEVVINLEGADKNEI